MKSKQKILPIDRGWAWLVVFGAFMQLFIMLGITKSLGIIFVEIIDKYQGSASSTAVMYSISAGISLFAAPLFTAAAEVFTCRVVCMCGGILSCIAFIAASQSVSLEQIIFAYGILGGFGHGCCLTPIPIIVGRYFDKKRALANGLAFSGTGLGSMVVPMIMYYIVDTYGLQGSLIVFSGFVLQTLVFSSLYRPMSYYINLGYTKENSDDGKNVDATKNAHTDETGENRSHEIDHVNAETNELTTKNQLYEDHDERYHSTFDNLHRHSGSKESLYFSAMNLAAGSALDIPTALTVTNPPQSEPVSSRNKLRELFKRLCYVKNESGELTCLFSVELLKNMEYMLVVGGVILALNGFFLTMIVPPHSADLKFTKAEAALLLSIQGGADMCGRLFTAFTGDCRRFKPYRAFAFGCYTLVSSVASFMILFAKDFYTLTALLIACSFFLGAFVAMNPVVLTDIVGIQKLGKAWGIQLFFEGFTITLAPVIMGALKDFTGSYKAAFVFLGVNFAISSVLIIWSAWLRKRRNSVAQ